MKSVWQYWLIIAAWLVLLVPANVGVAVAEALRGQALVIGQSGYAHLPALPNPVNDARAVAGLLERLGFSVKLAENRDADALAADVDGFVEAVSGADVALVYFSGHGVEAGGENFLLPVDAEPGVLDAGKGLVSLSALLAPLRARTDIVILLIDACRTNPFPPGTTVLTGDGPAGVPVGKEGLGISRGMTILSDGGDAENLGQVIGFAAEPGRAALDGEAGGNSPYAAALIKHFSAGEQRFSDIMTMVTEEVYLKTGTRQRPWTNASLRRLLYFGGNAEEEQGDEGELRGARRDLLLTIAATPEATRSYVERLAGREDLPLDALYGMLAELDVDTSAGPAQIGRQLRQGAENLKRFLAERVTPARSDAELKRLAGLAARAEAEGAIGLARKYRAMASARADDLSIALDKREGELSADRLELASVYADHAETALLSFDYGLAADRFRAAFEQAENWDDARAFRYRLGEADALTNQGSLAGDQDVLRRAIDVYEDALRFAPRDERPRDWAEAKNNLAGAWWSLGRREEGFKSFDIALAAYREALEERPRGEVPVLWAKTHNNIGNVLAEIGLRQEGTKWLNDAVKAYRQALKVFSPDREPFYFAVTQSNIGNALLNIGMRGKGTKTLNRAVEALETALAHQSPDDEPLAWSAAQRNLANTYLAIGERKRDTGSIEQAVEAYHATLEVQTRDQMPAEWAVTQINLGNALKTMGKLTGETARFEEAANAFKAALSQWTFEKSPRDWGVAMIELGGTRLEIGKISGDRDMVMDGKAIVEEARDAFLDAGYDQYRGFFDNELKPFDEALAKL